jgi:hypothetical protein
MAIKSKPDWGKFWAHFIFGALFGALIGLRVWAKSEVARSTSWFPVALLVFGGAAVWGLIAGMFANSGWDE